MRENKAITLVALVITIILAEVGIGFAINGNGIFDKAKQVNF